VSRRVDLPDDHAVRTTMTALLNEATAQGTTPTVVELAKRLGLTNSTFWRHFPDIANELRTTARTPNPDAPASPAARRFAELEQRNAELTRDNRQLTEHLDLAVVNLQRLTLDNHKLRRALEAASKVTRIDTKTRTP
jgi:AcrR family transcriptional regulator